MIFLPYLVLLLVGIAAIVLGVVARSDNRGIVIGAGGALIVYAVTAFLWSRFGVSSVVGFTPAVTLGSTLALNLLHAVPVALLIWAALRRGRTAAAPTRPASTWPGHGPGDAPTNGHW
ncbi:hypothetical protein J4H86_26260 [Spiractinospora alimapuensis]|uniref:hypothetical protein n=1 Tax=Spiractinospora alimapuensis TaxID=2820884 RepID=UPI001F1EF6A6|nr:hypothetical protein [Spiractinospora alimapuensis]QVQ52161.1 hypothetical protein J4H86_26260 [Spiractinospora alimapuensis]